VSRTLARHGAIATTRDQLRRITLPLLLLALGAALVHLALPRLAAAVVALPGDPVAEALQAEARPGAADLATLREGRLQAADFIKSGRLATDLALADLALLAEPGAPAEQARLLAEAVIELRRGLALAPMDGFAWARLAYVLAPDGGPSPAAVAAWRMSILTAPAEPRLAYWRMALGLALRPALAPADRDRLDQQIRWAWKYSPRQLVELARRPDLTAIIRAALAADPAQAQRFDAWLAH